MKNILETKAAKALNIIAIFKEGELVGRVYAYYSDSGVCTLEVWRSGLGKIHRSRASGFGYDKFTHALHGCVFDGHCLVDHATPLKGELAKKIYQPYDVIPKGYRFANLTKDGYMSCFQEPGLDYLVEMGYKIYTLL